MQFRPARVRIIPRDRLVFTEAVRMGEVDAREAYTELIMECEIQVDDAELKKIATIPEVAAQLSKVVEPQKPVYKNLDWRAGRYSAVKEAQWQKKPIIEYIANTYKADIIASAKAMFKTPADWTALLFETTGYRLEPRALQLSPTQDKQWFSIFLQVICNLGSAVDGKGFIGRLANEFEQAHQQNNIQKIEAGYAFKSTLTGFESTMKALDPYAGAKLSSTKTHGWDVADEPGYDKEIKSAFMDHLTDVAMDLYSHDARVTDIRDDGTILFQASGASATELGPECGYEGCTKSEWCDSCGACMNHCMCDKEELPSDAPGTPGL